MKHKSLILSLLLISLFYSCIQDEALNTEADIISCVIDSEYRNGTPKVDQEESEIIIYCKHGIENVLEPKFKITENATIYPTGPQDFSNSIKEPLRYTVTSQDKIWSRTYSVRLDSSKMQTYYNFEYCKLSYKDKYWLFYEMDGGVEQKIWATGNPGFNLSGMAQNYDDFPTISTTDGVIGKGVRMETKSTGTFGENIAMPIAAGNLFIGSFDLLSATQDALKATHFGLPFTYKPFRFKGWYKYKAGTVFRDKNLNVINKKDRCDIYAVLYSNNGDPDNYLNGYNILDIENNKNIVAIARIDDNPNVDLETDVYKEFDLPFNYLRQWTAEDDEDLARGKYNLAVVFSSSIRGAYFEGAARFYDGEVGSVLCIDEVEVVCEEK